MDGLMDGWSYVRAYVACLYVCVCEDKVAVLVLVQFLVLNIELWLVVSLPWQDCWHRQVIEPEETSEEPEAQGPTRPKGILGSSTSKRDAARHPKLPSFPEASGGCDPHPGLLEAAWPEVLRLLNVVRRAIASLCQMLLCVAVSIDTLWSSF